MKLLLLSLLATTLGGVGGYGLAGRTDELSSPAAAVSECRATVECTPRGTCIITCYDENGDECCRKEIECDRPCAGAEDCSGQRACSRE